MSLKDKKLLKAMLKMMKLGTRLKKLLKRLLEALMKQKTKLLLKMNLLNKNNDRRYKSFYHKIVRKQIYIALNVLINKTIN